MADHIDINDTFLSSAGRADRRWNVYEKETESPLLQAKYYNGSGGGHAWVGGACNQAKRGIPGVESSYFSKTGMAQGPSRQIVDTAEVTYFGTIVIFHITYFQIEKKI